MRIQRGKDDIRVYVRYPRSERRSLNSLKGMFVRTPQACKQIPFSQVAEIIYARGYSIIKHKDRNRIINVFADIDSKKGNSGQLVSELGQSFVPMLKRISRCQCFIWWSSRTKSQVFRLPIYGLLHRYVGYIHHLINNI